MSAALEIGTILVNSCNEGKAEEVMESYYSPAIVSIEAQDFEGMPARMEGIEAVQGKSEWWFANNEVHSMKATGPFVGGHEDRFSVQFEIDVTPKGGERMQMTEIGLYTVKDGKIVEEEFWPLAG